MSGSEVCHYGISSAFDLLLIFLCSLIQTLTLTPPPNNALLANMDMRDGWCPLKNFEALVLSCARSGGRECSHCSVNIAHCFDLST